jgi:hypothetical protein
LCHSLLSQRNVICSQSYSLNYCWWVSFHYNPEKNKTHQVISYFVSRTWIAMLKHNPNIYHSQTSAKICTTRNTKSTRIQIHHSYMPVNTRDTLHKGIAFKKQSFTWWSMWNVRIRFHCHKINKKANTLSKIKQLVIVLQS